MRGLENEISYQQALIEEREQGIREIEEAMTEVHELFCDIGLIVTDQQGALGKGPRWPSRRSANWPPS